MRLSKPITVLVMPPKRKKHLRSLRKRFSLKPMDVEEAIMQMELLGHDFFVFTNVIDDEVNVVYKRREGNYGIIEPDF